jgi:UDP-N-acetylmuramoylalanine--D-glutamate ligase
MSQGKLVILGAGESGQGAALLGQAKGYNVFVSDGKQMPEKARQLFAQHKIDYEQGGHDLARLVDADIAVKSPGIPDSAAVVQALIAHGVEVISEIEWGFRFTNKPIIAITGSNGKTTTTSMIHKLLTDAGLTAGLGGNIGRSFAAQVMGQEPDYYVLEVSSFQLDGTTQFQPHIAVITNITPDHLDRYNYKFEAYIASKMSITRSQTPEDFLVYDYDDPVLAKSVTQTPINASLMPYSTKTSVVQGSYIDRDTLVINTPEKLINMPTLDLNVKGTHNQKNAMAAATVAALLNIRKETIRQSLEHFQSVEHRLEYVLKINNVTYINDSKATNVNSVYYALESMHSPTVWIVGGEDKGNDYNELLPLVNEKVKAIICLGLNNEKIIQTFGSVVDMLVETHSMSDAVQVAYRLAQRGDTVLLSPACASFDLFENYEDRGRQFKNAVRQL